MWSTFAKDFQIIETKDFQELYDQLTTCSDGTMVLIDIDNTVITPKAAMFRTGCPYKNLVQDIKTGKYKDVDIEKVVSEWRLKRKVMLIHPGWPHLVTRLHELSIPVFAFTQMGTGRYGAIESLEHWRYKELKSLNIVFSEQFAQQAEIVLLPHTDQMRNAALFYKGIFLAGDYDKTLVLPKILELHRPKQVIIVDDLLENVNRLREVCREIAVPYTGIAFRGVDCLPDQFNERIVLIQKNTLLQSGKWLEDEEVARA